MRIFVPLMAMICFLACNNFEKEQTVYPVNETLPTSLRWNWADSLDAIVVAPESHNIVYEDSTVRILKVICLPGVEEPIHTHKYKSVMWFTQSAHFIYYNYILDSNNQLVKNDSTEIKGFPAEILDKGQMVEPEHPHSIKNIGVDTFLAYRTEYKVELK
ncbi:hypothetical protein [Gynurincola endophyticus]|uniref:hypothetical protein n=1 Tax=Gynurincola endophyticus TaxID=2479004 RepID=UPI000F8D87BC|nr:hypothetical protein [Gynurincola endophyticus]